MITQEDVNTYLLNGGTKCPFCGSNEIVVGRQIEVDGMRAWQRISCYDCNAEWNDIYTLTDIEAII